MDIYVYIHVYNVCTCIYPCMRYMSISCALYGVSTVGAAVRLRVAVRDKADEQSGRRV